MLKISNNNVEIGFLFVIIPPVLS